jgi:hypothetical protein
MTRVSIETDESLQAIRDCLESKGITVKVIAQRIIAEVPKGSSKSPEDEVTHHLNNSAITAYVTRIRSKYVAPK